MATLPFDPLFNYQWHLWNRTPGLLDLNVVDVWDDYTGAGVQVAVIDDAVQWTHPDLIGNYSTTKDWDFDNNDGDPSGVNGDNHGTAVAGIIGASSNGIGGVGVAHGATIFGFQTYGFISQKFIQNVTQAINNTSGRQWQVGVNREADVVNMSIGTQNGGYYFDLGLDRIVMSNLHQAIDNASQFGRGGLGTILVKSAGNSRKVNHDTNASSWESNPHIIARVSASQRRLTARIEVGEGKQKRGHRACRHRP